MAAARKSGSVMIAASVSALVRTPEIRAERRALATFSAATPRSAWWAITLASSES